MAQMLSEPNDDDRPPRSDVRELSRGPEPIHIPDFPSLYENHVDFVYRSVRRLGVAESAAEDITQEVFLTVHRRLDSFEGRSSLKTWIFGVTLGIVRNHRRSAARHRQARGPRFEETEHEPEVELPDPHEQVERREALRILHEILHEMDDDKRAVFVLAELEGVAPADIAALEGTKLFTTYSRIRAARAQFKKLASRLCTLRGWRDS